VLPLETELLELYYGTVQFVGNVILISTAQA